LAQLWDVEADSACRVSQRRARCPLRLFKRSSDLSL
jgi:hypothetical protein